MTKLKITSGKKTEFLKKGNWEDQLMVFLDAWAHDQLDAEGTGPTWKEEVEKAKEELDEKLTKICTDIEMKLHDGQYY
jgi:hypothetical protein